MLTEKTTLSPTISFGSDLQVGGPHAKRFAHDDLEAQPYLDDVFERIVALQLGPEETEAE